MTMSSSTICAVLLLPGEFLPLCDAVAVRGVLEGHAASTHPRNVTGIPAQAADAHPVCRRQRCRPPAAAAAAAAAARSLPRRHPHPVRPGEAKDWAALPQDILLAIFLKLGPRDEIMQGAELVCTAWRRAAAVDEPMLWRRVDMGTVSTTWSTAGRAMARAAVDRGAGQCEAFSARFECDGDLLLYLVESFSYLSFFSRPVTRPIILELFFSAPVIPAKFLFVHYVESALFEKAPSLKAPFLKKIPLLEDLEVSLLYVSSGTYENSFDSVCQACPLLNKLKMTFSTTVTVHDKYYNEDLIREKIKGVATTMCELRTLELLNCDLTAEKD
ncbi:hypothetical protein C2845_PM13G05020 [Panicum miliaceum]|uniref:F-box domain-containing protein n=1 Tax=Panicum miliaceum TaxID=4540 RepID=A0A3L6RH21_PANMI|nr:hypothetical protein C2845_PM13G05020 [Panicum miliaceum]